MQREHIKEQGNFTYVGFLEPTFNSRHDVGARGRYLEAIFALIWVKEFDAERKWLRICGGMGKNLGFWG